MRALASARALAAALFAGALVVNVLANILPLGGRTTGELSAQFPNLFVPAGITFSIWSVIYLLLAAWAVAQFLPSRAVLGARIAPAFALTSLLNAGWLFAWHYGLVAISVGIMATLLLVLLHMNSVLAGEAGIVGKAGSRSLGTAGREAPGAKEAPRLLPRMAFGIYLGWICVALIANATALLVGLGWDGAGFSDASWAMIMVGVGGAAGGFAALRLRNPFLAWAVVWALAGIVLNRWEDHLSVAGVAAAMATAVALLSSRAPIVAHRRAS